MCSFRCVANEQPRTLERSVRRSTPSTVVVGRSWAPKRGAPTGRGRSCRRLHRRRWLHGPVDCSRAEGARPVAETWCLSRRRPAAQARAGVTAGSCTVTGQRLPICCLCSDRSVRCSSHVPAERIVPAVRAFCESRGEDVWLRESGTMMVSAAPAQDDAVDRAVAAAAEVGAPEQAVPLDDERRRRANSFACLPSRRPFP